PPGVAANREPLLLLVELSIDPLVPLEEGRSEPEELHLFRVILAREHDLEVHQHASVRGTPAKHAELLARELRLGEERRKPRDDEDRDGPGGEAEEQTRVARERDRVPRERERPRDEAQRPNRRLLSRAVQLVVELRVLEVREVERQRLLDDHDVDALREPEPKQGLAEIGAALSRGDTGDERALERDE